MKLNEVDTKTKNVYINIVNEDSVDTLTMETKQALKKYGDYELISMDGEPTDDEMDNENTMTNVVIKNIQKEE